MASTLLLPEYEQVINHLERGTVVTKFFHRKRPERRTLFIRRETRQVVWSRAANQKTGEGFVEIREIKEVRAGRSSKDFDRWQDEARKHEVAKCFVIFYGQEFRLKVLSVAGKTLVLCLLLFLFKDRRWQGYV